MITSHAHQPTDTMTSSSVSSAPADPFTPSADATADSPAQFEDDFDIPPINIPPSALEDQQHTVRKLTKFWSQ